MSYNNYNKCTKNINCKPNYKFCRRRRYEKLGILILGIGLGFVFSFILLKYSLIIGCCCICLGLFLMKN